ncbi:hypothetical protein GF312_22005 [Candidatus Poribacteria bacterium]|nr:hypothetical protein [Candidatus Poribacteria bacterium]
MKINKKANKINTGSIRDFYRRLNHSGYGITELAVIDPKGERGVIATGFFDNEDAFVKACITYNDRYNIYAGRNPRPKWLPKVCENCLDTRYRQRAKDSDVQYITAMSLDIDPARPKGMSSTDRQHERAIKFGLNLQKQLGGWVDDSGNGAYLWIPFKAPVKLTGYKRDQIKQKCKIWQDNIIKAHRPDKYGLRIDGCFDLSRLKKVIGTMSVKGKKNRLSRFVKMDVSTDDKVRDAILSQPVYPESGYCPVKPSQNLPVKFLRLLKLDPIIQNLWLTPNQHNDTSMHDWSLGYELAQAGMDAGELARVLMFNPFGKYQRDRRYGYIQNTVRNIMSKCSSD